MKIYNQQQAIGKPYSLLYEYTTEFNSYIKGVFIFAHGAVRIYAEGPSNNGKSVCRLDICKNGVQHMRTITRKKAFSERSAAIYAGKFAREIYSNQEL